MSSFISLLTCLSVTSWLGVNAANEARAALSKYVSPFKRTPFCIESCPVPMMMSALGFEDVGPALGDAVGSSCHSRRPIGPGAAPPFVECGPGPSAPAGTLLRLRPTEPGIRAWAMATPPRSSATGYAVTVLDLELIGNSLSGLANNVPVKIGPNHRFHSARMGEWAVDVNHGTVDALLAACRSSNEAEV